MAVGNRDAEAWWEVLGVSRHARLDEVASAYRTLAMQLHPDVWVGASEKHKAVGHARMKSINAAFERAMHDISLREECKAAAASASVRKTDAGAATVDPPQGPGANKRTGNWKPGPRRFFINRLGLALAILALILLVRYLDSNLGTPHRRVTAVPGRYAQFAGNHARRTTGRSRRWRLEQDDRRLHPRDSRWSGGRQCVSAPWRRLRTQGRLRQGD